MKPIRGNPIKHNQLPPWGIEGAKKSRDLHQAGS